MKKIALILAGGKGTRLWPLSRENYPKQFVPFKDNMSLFQMALVRIGRTFRPEDIYIISHENYRFTILNQTDMLNGIKSAFKDKIKKNLVFEPSSKSTLPAVLLCMKYAEEKRALREDDLIYVFPSDHMIEPLPEFIKSIRRAGQLAGDKKIVVFGVKPDYPKEGYGYIIKSKRHKSGFLIDRFVEKPLRKSALALIKKGAFWNAGIFCFTKGTFLRELKKFQPAIAQYSGSGYGNLIKNFKAIKPISMDYGIMQHTKNAAVVEFNLKWSDLGSWDSFLQFFTRKKGNFNIGKAEFLKSSGNFTYSENRLMCLVGLKDVIAIDSPDALLLVKKGHSDSVKELVSIIKKKGYKELNRW